MKSINFFFTLSTSLFLCLVNTNVKAQSKNGIFPPDKKPISRPTKITSSVDLNNFVTQAFDFYDQVNSAKLALQNIYGGLNNGSGAELNKILGDLDNKLATFQALVPEIENLVTTSPDLYEKVRAKLPIFQYPRAALNFKAACGALTSGIGDLKFMISNTLPGIKAMVIGSTPKTDTTAASKS